MILDALIRDLVRPEGDAARTHWAFLQGLVVSRDGATVGVDLTDSGGAEVVPDLRFPAGTNPQPGAAVWVAVQGGSAMFVAFVLA